GTGEGAMLACNIYPNVLCGHLEDVEDAFMFAQINDGNAIALPFAKKFGWGGELTLTYMFEKLLGTPSGGGYPPERVEPEQRNKKILDEMKKITHKDMMTILREVDQDFLRETISGEHFAELFYPNCQVPEIAEYLKSL
ncbi:MAG: RpiB/LacA/LacB family sugar-phosphate isomerase, partial [Lachnospiraceae bacterium]|nr:RpiB/LacA/LacB family sugar-phosphate isomerase [Lachnospiraceae bacterium]